MRARGSLHAAAVLLAALTALAGTSELSAQAEENRIDPEQRGFWRWALADVAGGEQLDTGEEKVRIPTAPGGEKDGAARGRRGGAPGGGGKVGERGRGGGPPAGLPGPGPRLGHRPAGPPFCRSGVGHPVHGRLWCLRHGFGLGPIPWILIDLGDIVFGGRGPRDGRLGTGDLLEVLGREALEGILGRAHAADRRGEVTGRWKQVDGIEGRVLQLRAGTTPVAELNDLDGDGKVDRALLYEGGR